jgi:peptidoglycan/LPS O-acetylase OafA/YrhL
VRNDVGSRSFSAWVDAFRWLAAASVLITHAGLRMLVPVGDMPAVSLSHVAYAFFAGFDHQAVMIFFVLSGLLVGGSVMREVSATGQIAFGAYLGRRIVRLCLVLWPALALAAICTSLSLALGANRLGILPADTAATLSMRVLLCNAVFLQTAACPQFAANGALWSLFNEFWYYLLFPPLALAVLPRLRLGTRVALGGLAVAALAGLTSVQFTGSPIGPYMLVWVVGVAAARLPRPVIRRPWLAAGLLVAGSVATRVLVRRSFAELHPLLSAELDFGLALLFGNLLLALRCCPALAPPPWARLHGALSGFSFSLYCTHIPVLVLYITLLSGLYGIGWQMSGTGAVPWLALGGGLTLCVAVAWGFAQLTEVHTSAVRGWLANTWPVQRLAAHGAR